MINFLIKIKILILIFDNFANFDKFFKGLKILLVIELKMPYDFFLYRSFLLVFFF